MSRSNHVIRKRPEITLGPNLRHWLIFRQPNDGRHRRGIAGEVGDRRHQKGKRSGTHVERNQFVSPVSGPAAHRYLRQIENELHQLQPPRRPPVKLRQSAHQPEQQRLRKTHFQNADQREQKIYRQRPFNAGQAYLQGRRQNHCHQIADEFNGIGRVPEEKRSGEADEGHSRHTGNISTYGNLSSPRHCGSP